jgi:hypothetical protein
LTFPGQPPHVDGWLGGGLLARMLEIDWVGVA